MRTEVWPSQTKTITPEPGRSSVPVYQKLWLRGFRDHTISGRGFNLFKPLRHHFRATPFAVSPSRAAIPATKRLQSKRSTISPAVSAGNAAQEQIYAPPKGGFARPAGRCVSCNCHLDHHDSERSMGFGFRKENIREIDGRGNRTPSYGRPRENDNGGSCGQPSTYSIR